MANDKITIDDLADAIGERLTVYQSEKARKILGVTKSTIHYRKLGRSWLESERYFLTTYYFDFIEKEI